MTENEGGPGVDPGGEPEPIQDDRDGGDPSAAGGKRPADERTGGAPADDQSAIDLEAARDRAS